MQNGKDALVASAYGTWNNVEHRGHSIQRHAPMPFDGARSRQARPSRATIPEETTGGTRLSRPPTERGTQGTSHSAPRADAVRWGTVATSATLPRDHPGGDKREGRACRVRLRNVEQRGTQGTSHSAPRAEGVRWGTVATSATLPATIPEETTGGTRLSRPPTERGVRPRNPPGETSRDPPRAKNKARREHASGRTGLAEGGGFEPPIR